MSDDTAADDPLEGVVAEFLEQRRRGERPSIESYAQAYPELAAEIRDLFPTLVSLEDLGPGSSCETSPGGSVPSPPQLECPRQLGEFRIVRELGRGGMGVVYEAIQESLHRRVALKVFPHRGLFDTRGLARFRREARTIGALNHANIVAIHTVGQQQGVHYLVMQLVEGVGLDRLVPRCGRRIRPARFAGPADASDPLPEDPLADRLAAALVEGAWTATTDLSATRATNDPTAYWRGVAAVIEQAAAALQYAHAAGILHRDIKPANLLLDGDGVTRVTDFGLARVLDDERLSRTGERLGTLRYMAPEQLEGEADQRSDLYGLGVTLYELLSFRPAYDAAKPGEILRQMYGPPPPPPRHLTPAVPAELEEITLRAMARRREDRYQSAAELRAALSRFMHAKPPEAPAPRSHAPARSWRAPGKVPLMWGGIGIAVGLLAAAVWWMEFDTDGAAEPPASAVVEDPRGAAASRVEELAEGDAPIGFEESAASGGFPPWRDERFGPRGPRPPGPPPIPGRLRERRPPPEFRPPRPRP